MSEHRFGFGPPDDGGTPILIDDPAVLKALTDPLRHEIVGLLDHPMSAKEVAAALDVPATRLYYHLDLLVERGLAKVADHRTVGRNVERLFVRAGDRFVISEELSRLAVASPEAASNLQRGVNEHVANMLAVTTAEAAAREPEHAVVMVLDVVLRLPPGRGAELVDRFNELVAEFDDHAGSTGEQYSLLVMLAPKANAAKNKTKKNERAEKKR